MYINRRYKTAWNNYIVSVPPAGIPKLIVEYASYGMWVDPDYDSEGRNEQR